MKQQYDGNLRCSHCHEPLMPQTTSCSNCGFPAASSQQKPLSTVVRESEQVQHKDILVFFSYAHNDRHLRDQLENHLSNLKYRGLITTWHAEEISAGEEIFQQVDIYLKAAHIILLLISASFLASEYCYGREMTHALGRHERGEARVIPVLLRPVLFTNAPFAKLAPLPTNGKPVTRWKDREEAFYDIARGIERIVFSLQAPNADYQTEVITIASFDQLAAQRREEAQRQEAIRKWEEERQTIPVNYSHELAATIYQVMGLQLDLVERYDEALAAYEQAAALSPEPVIYDKMGDIFVKLGRDEEAVNVYKQALQLDATYTCVYAELSKALSRLGRTQEAEQARAHQEREEARRREEILRRKEIQRQKEAHLYYEDALSAYERALLHNSTDALAYRGKGNVLTALSRYDEALVAFEHAVTFVPHPATYVSMGNVLRKLGRNNEAVQAYKQALALDTTYASAYTGISEALLQLGRTQEAEQAREKAKQLGDEDE